EIKKSILFLSGQADVAIIEIGGTIGDIESLPFQEAIRQLKRDLGKDNVLYVHLTLVPYVKAAGEFKTKPTQHSVKELRSIGIQPDIILCRTDQFLSKDIKAKIALFCNVDVDQVITAKDVDSIYEVPLVLHQEHLDEKIIELLHMWTRAPRLQAWEKLAEEIKSLAHTVTIAIAGKYINLKESYKSLNEALTHGGIANNANVLFEFIDSEVLETGDLESLKKVDGILVPGGFGVRGIEGKITAIQYARENNVPFLGICLGMQMAVVEFARHVAGLDGANSAELDEQTAYPVIYLMQEWYDHQNNIVQKRDISSGKGGTMRVGAYPCLLSEDSIAFSAYGKREISERHRHRYEFNTSFKQRLEEKGLRVSGMSPNGELVEIVEIRGHPWFLGCQFHPEFKSRPMDPHPLFRDFIKAALAFRQKI
ncbi:MAG: CTP synthase, partial [Pseudomonadota bacterium]